jgi:hypothetical protein
MSAKGSVVFMQKSFLVPYLTIDIFYRWRLFFAPFYQLAFTTPGISPLSARSLKQMRHNPKSRM